MRQAQNQRRPAGEGRPAAEAAGRAKNQRFRVTSAREDGPRVATSAEPAETSRRSKTSGGSCRTSQEPAVPRDKRARGRTESCDKRRTSGDQPAKQDQRRKLPDEPRTRGSARQASARTSQSPAGIPKGQARADEAKHWVYAWYKWSAKEFEDGQVRQAGLTRKLPSPALKEAERSGSYNPSALNTLTRGTVRHGTVQGHTAGRATRAALCDSRQT